MMGEFAIVLLLAFMAIPIIALVRTFLLDRRIRELDLKTEMRLDEKQTLQSLTARIYALERQLVVLEARAPASAPAAEAVVVPQPHAVGESPIEATPPALDFVPAPSLANYPEPAPAAAVAGISEHEEAPKELEASIGLVWINRIAALTLILAAAFFFKYAVDNQWIGETGRIVLGIMAGFAAVGAGEWAWRRGHGLYAQGVTALGIAVLYLSFFAAFDFYHLPAVPQSAAFVLMALTVAMGGALAMRYDAAAISVFALLGGYLVPVLLSTGQDRPWVLFSYLLLLDLGAIAVGRAKRWQHLAPLALGGTALLYYFWFDANFTSGKQLVATLFVFVFCALFVLLDSAVLEAVAQILASAALLAIGSSVGLGESWILSNGWLFVALAAAGLAVSEWRLRPYLVRVTALSFWLCFGLWQGANSSQRPGLVVPAAVAGFVLFLCHQAWRIAVRKQEADELALALIVLNAAAAFGITYHQLDTAYHAWLGLTAAAFALVHLPVAARIWKGIREEQERDATPVMLLVGVALAFLTLAVPLQFSAYRITMAWALEGAALAWIGSRTESRRLRQSALVVFAFALMRLLFLDAWIYGIGARYGLFANARFLTFATAAASLWLSVQWLDDKRAKLAVYVAGHLVLLWTLVMEVVGQVERGFPPERVFSVATVSVSVLIAAYGVVLIGAFVLGRFAVNRLLGLILLGGVVAKLYLGDVWVLDRIYRIIAFGFLGILLLLTSFLYSRYRTRIGSWRKDETNRT